MIFYAFDQPQNSSTTAARDKCARDQASLISSLQEKSKNFEVDQEHKKSSVLESIKNWDDLKSKQVIALTEQVQDLKGILRGDDFYLSKIEALQSKAKCDACG